MDHRAESRAAVSAHQQQWRLRWTHLSRQLRRGLPFFTGVVATLVGLFLHSFLFPSPVSLTTRDVDSEIAHALASVTPSPPHSVRVYQTILPALVAIQINAIDPLDGNLTQMNNETSRFVRNGISTYEKGISYLIADNYQREGDRDEDEEEPEPIGIGSGVVINAEGAILTALHIVEQAESIRVTFADGTRAAAQLVIAEPDNDIAVLQADQLPEIFAPATLGNPNAMRVGDEAYVVGNPIGLAGSMSAGVISGFDRTATPANLGYELTRLIQFDAAVNLGNSGGPLLNRDGEVIGIVIGLVNPTDQVDFSGIGLAIRIDVAGGAAGLPPQ